MITLPKGQPAVENLNSFYLDSNKMIEHYQGELGAGCVHFKSSSEEGLVFFDTDDLLNGVLKNANGEKTGSVAVDLIIKASFLRNFNIDIYKIEPAKIYLWANIPYARVIQKLNSEYTDLETLIKKMSVKKLTGYIDVSVDNGKDGGIIFFGNGGLVGNFFSWTNGFSNISAEDLALLAQKINSEGGNFKICHITVKSEKRVQQGNASVHPERSIQFDVLEDLLVIFEKTYNSQKKRRMAFSSVLKKKFLEKADKYEFVDPFAAEFEYTNQKISYAGNQKKEAVIIGVVECVRELVNDLNLTAVLKRQLKHWVKKYDWEIKTLKLTL